jgi:hypothetical protein
MLETARQGQSQNLSGYKLLPRVSIGGQQAHRSPPSPMCPWCVVRGSQELSPGCTFTTGRFPPS